MYLNKQAIYHHYEKNRIGNAGWVAEDSGGEDLPRELRVGVGD